MKKKLLICSLAFLFVNTATSIAQTRAEIIQNINKLVLKAKGQKIEESLFDQKPVTVQEQILSETSFVLKQKTKGDKDNYVINYSVLDWNKMFDYSVYEYFMNSKVCQVKVEFTNTFDRDSYYEPATSGSYPLHSNDIEFYCLVTDQSKMEDYLKQLEALIPPKAESAYNNEIRKFTKEQTIAWLEEKLLNHTYGDDYTTDLALVSIDECKIVFYYESMVGRKYEETIPTQSTSVNKHGVFNNESDKCSIKYYAFGLIQEEDETVYSQYSFLSLWSEENEEELFDNVSCALKHLAGFCK